MFTVILHPDFADEFKALPVAIRAPLRALAELISEQGPTFGRPRVDTLNGSKHPNMKEMRFDAGGGVWRVAFAFDPKRNVLVLVAGDKSGVAEQRFYKRLIATADARYDDHLEWLKGAKR